jgi:hypothetical protein
MQGNRIADFHVRVGVLDQADREYRAILREQGEDEHARAMLTDVIALRRALGEETEPMPARANASMQALKKNAPRSGGQGWASGGRAAPAPREWDSDSTASLPASDEAELLLKLGKAQQALDMYRILAIRHPKQQAYRKRIAEIEALIAQRVTPMAAEVTVRTDLSELSLVAIPTNPRAELEREHPSFAEDEDVPTNVDKMPGRE